MEDRVKALLHKAYEDPFLTNVEILDAFEQHGISYDQIQRQRLQHRRSKGLPPLKPGRKPDKDVQQAVRARITDPGNTVTDSDLLPVLERIADSLEGIRYALDNLPHYLNK